MVRGQSYLIGIAREHFAQEKGGWTMRKLGLAAILWLGFGAVSTTWAQSLIRPQGVQPSAFSFTNVFRSFSMPSFPPRTGQSALPPPSSFPSTRYQDFQAVPFTPATPFFGYMPNNNR